MRTVFTGGGWTVTEEEAPMPNGKISKRTRVQFADSAHIIAETKDGNVLILREYRPFYAAWIWMLPSGHVDKESDPTVAAQRELQEETGFRAAKIIKLWKMRATEKMKNSHHFYLASDLTKDPLPQDEDECIEVHELPAEEALKRVEASQDVHMASAYGLQRYLREIKSMQR